MRQILMPFGYLGHSVSGVQASQPWWGLQWKALRSCQMLKHFFSHDLSLGSVGNKSNLTADGVILDNSVSIIALFFCQICLITYLTDWLTQCKKRLQTVWVQKCCSKKCACHAKKVVLISMLVDVLSYFNGTTFPPVRMCSLKSGVFRFQPARSVWGKPHPDLPPLRSCCEELSTAAERLFKAHQMSESSRSRVLLLHNGSTWIASCSDLAWSWTVAMRSARFSRTSPFRRDCSLIFKIWCLSCRYCCGLFDHPAIN